MAPTFKQLAIEFEKRKTLGWTHTTVKSFRSNLAVHLLPAFGNTPLISITNKLVAEWFFTTSRKSPGSANHALAVLRSMMNYAQKTDVVPESHGNPCDGILPNRTRKLKQFLNSDALARLGVALSKFRQSHPDVVDIIELTLLTGCRPAEIMGLRWKDITTDYITLTGSATGPRTIPMTSPASAILLARKKCHGHSSYVFLSRSRNGKPLTNIHLSWDKVRKHADLPKGFRLLDLRHTYSTHAIDIGESSYVLNALLGHHKWATTAQYTNMQASNPKQAAENIGAIIAGWLDMPCNAAIIPGPINGC